MGYQKVEAYKCEWCGKLVFETWQHDTECRYDPKARTCPTCIHSTESKNIRSGGKTISYCPRADCIFEYPHVKYCADYRFDERFKSLAKEVEG